MSEIDSQQFLAGAIVVIMIAAGILGYWFFYSGNSETPGGGSAKEQLAACLTNQEITLYGLPTCSHCQEQKELFGEAFEHVDYVDCSEEETLCQNKGVSLVPTWEIEGEMIEGKKTLEELAELSGCEYPPSQSS